MPQETRGWKNFIADSSETDLGGFKRSYLVLLMVKMLYSLLKFESVHRVQRVPETESLDVYILQL